MSFLCGFASSGICFLVQTGTRRGYHTVDQGLKQGKWVLQRSKTHRVYERHVKQTFVRPCSPGSSNEHRALALLKRNDTFINLHAFREFVKTNQQLTPDVCDDHETCDDNNNDPLKNPTISFNYWQSIIDEKTTILRETQQRHESEIRELLQDHQQTLSEAKEETKILALKLKLAEEEVNQLRTETDQLKLKLALSPLPS